MSDRHKRHHQIEFGGWAVVALTRSEEDELTPQVHLGNNVATPVPVPLLSPILTIFLCPFTASHPTPPCHVLGPFP